MDTKAYIESGIIESYVLGLASAEEAVELEMLCMQYPAIKKAVDEFAIMLEKQAFTNAIIPQPEIKEHLMTALSNEFGAKPEKDDTPVVPLSGAGTTISNARVKKISLMRYIAVASVILLIASTALNFYLYTSYKNASNAYQALLVQHTTLQARNDAFQTKLNGLEESMRIMQNPDMRVITLKGQPGNENSLASVYWDRKTKDVYLLPTRLDTPPSGKQYQLWAIVNGKPVDAGVVGDCNGVCKMTNITNADAFAITLEKEGGSTTPTLPIYALGKI